jgi:hypothetical protein
MKFTIITTFGLDSVRSLDQITRQTVCLRGIREKSVEGFQNRRNEMLQFLMFYIRRRIIFFFRERYLLGEIRVGNLKLLKNRFLRQRLSLLM